MAAPTNTLLAPSSLYVGDLHPYVDEHILYQAFSEYLSVSSVRLCREWVTGRSLGYGYVNFFSHQDAKNALETKNNITLCGRMIRVTWSRRDPLVRRSGAGNVFVKNLNESIDNVQLQEMFRGFGNILSCKVATFEDGVSKGFGFVQFDTEDCANAAIENLNGKDVGGKQIYVGKFMKKSEREGSAPDTKYTNLYIKNLELDMTKDVLEQTFAKFGKILSLVIARDDDGVSKGFGFVNFENPNDARKAVEEMNGSQLGSKVLYVARAQKKSEREQILRSQFAETRKEQIRKYQDSNVYVKNIDDDVTEDQLRDHFRHFGTITSVKLMRDDNGVCRGFGFVCFSKPEEARHAVHSLHGYIFHKKRLYVSIAERKEQRQARLIAQRMSGLPAPGAHQHSFYYSMPMMYQPMDMRAGWRANGYAPPTRHVFQSSAQPFIPNPSRPYQPHRGRINNGHVQQPYVSHFQQAAQSPVQSSSLQQRSGQSQFAQNGRARADNGAKSSGPVGGGSEMLASVLSAASPEVQKQILGDRIFPLVKQQQPELATKITGMLLEIDNTELLVLLDSPDHLATKVKEAVQVLSLSETDVSINQEAIQSSVISPEVAVN